MTLNRVLRAVWFSALLLLILISGTIAAVEAQAPPAAEASDDGGVDVAVVVRRGSRPDVADLRLINMLSSSGRRVGVVDDADPDLLEFVGAAGVGVVSSSVFEASIPEGLGQVGTPLLVLDGNLFDELGWFGSRRGIG